MRLSELANGPHLCRDVAVRGAALFLVLCACGTDFGAQTSFECEASGLRFETAVPLHADRVQFNAELARELLAKYSIVPAEDISALFHETTIHVLERGCLNEDSEKTGTCIMGRSYAGSTDVFSNVTTFGFFHELMHRQDDKMGLGIQSQWHWTWGDDRRAAEAEWEARYMRTVTITNPKATWAACGGPPR